MTDYRAEAYTQIQVCLNRVDKMLARYAGLTEEAAMLRMLRAERVELIDRLIALASTVPPDLPGIHPPVPDQADPDGPLAEWIDENAHLWAGWQPGAWPARNPLDPRGFRWELPPAEG